MNMQPVHSMPRFSSKIQFVSREEMNSLNGKDRNRNFVPGVMMCNAGGLQNYDQVAMFQMIPEVGNLGDDTEWITARIDHLRHNEGRNPVRGLLVGGDSFYQASKTYRNALETVMRDKDVSFSKLWGHRNDAESKVFFSLEDDTWFINTRFRTKSGNEQDVSNLSDVQEAFEDIELDRNDTLIVGRKRYDNEDIEAISGRCLEIIA